MTRLLSIVGFMEVVVFLILINAITNVNSNDDGIVGILMLVSFIAVFNPIYPFFKRGKLDTPAKRRNSLLIPVGIAFQVLSWMLFKDDLNLMGFEEFLEQIVEGRFGSMKMFWFGTYIVLAGIASSFAYESVVKPIKNWIGSEPS